MCRGGILQTMNKVKIATEYGYKLDEKMLYDEKGWCNIPYILSLPFTFIITVGGRGIGKTYGVLKELWNTNTPFIYMRRTGTQLDMISPTELHPIRKVADDNNFEYVNDAVAPRVSGIYEYKDSHKGNIRGYNMALSLMATVRGFDASWIDFLFYDEYIKESHEKSIKNEFKALINAYETLNRNRELEGRKPLRMFLASNSEDIFNPILDGFGVVQTFIDMQKNDTSLFADIEKSLLLIDFRNSPVSALKKSTAIGKLTQDNREISNMMYDNKFDITAQINIGLVPLREMSCICGLENISFWIHKGSKLLYCVNRKATNNTVYTCIDIKHMFQNFPVILTSILKNTLIYENESVYIHLINMMK